MAGEVAGGHEPPAGPSPPQLLRQTVHHDAQDVHFVGFPVGDQAAGTEGAGHPLPARGEAADVGAVGVRASSGIGKSAHRFGNLLVLPAVTESLAGRMETARLMPLSEAEKQRRPGLFLTDLLRGDITPALHAGVEAPDPADLGRRLVSGGYPEPLARSPARARQWHRQYVRSIVDRDVLDVGRVRDADGVARLLQLLAARNGELLNTAGLSRELGLHRNTVREYTAVLERLFLVRRLLESFAVHQFVTQAGGKEHDL